MKLYRHINNVSNFLSRFIALERSQGLKFHFDVSCVFLSSSCTVKYSNNARFYLQVSRT